MRITNNLVHFVKHYHIWRKSSTVKCFSARDKCKIKWVLFVLKVPNHRIRQIHSDRFGDVSCWTEAYDRIVQKPSDRCVNRKK